MKVAQVYLLSREPKFQPFTYYVRPEFDATVGSIVIVPFRKGIEAGVISSISESQDIKGLLPTLGMVTGPQGRERDFGKLLLALSEILLCSPGEAFDHVAFGNPNKRITLFFFAPLKCQSLTS